MLQIILILLGLATPNSDANTQNTNSDQTVITQTNDSQNSDAPTDTGGETEQLPKK
ncbi:hypothetical protein SAMN05421847_0140 [Halpernia humi]|uniref:Uncharacterized protein n=1 Tax=Halpernia humi TaxID=493375 RepID=A0A1H5SH06_9FLAO|nr:hypothetical protein [Halpernia humi]SEF49730.1 hypothetical protein SAMN05421847_0140 [Halpernia humi]